MIYDTNVYDTKVYNNTESDLLETEPGLDTEPIDEPSSEPVPMPENVTPIESAKTGYPDLRTYVKSVMPHSANKLLSALDRLKEQEEFEKTPDGIKAKEARLAREQIQAEQQYMTRELNKAGIPANFHNANFKTDEKERPLKLLDPDYAKVRQYCIELCKNWKRGHKGLTLYSESYGCGKTYLGFATLRVILKRYRVPVKYVKAGELLKRYRNTYDGISTITDVFTEHAVKPAVLLLDELGAEQVRADSRGDWAREKLLELIDYRFEHEMTTIVTTNLTEAELSAKYGGRLVSRMLGSSPFVKVSGPDYRRNVSDGESPF